MTNQDPSVPADVSPFDTLWSWIATATLSTSVIVFTLMSMGQSSIFGIENPMRQMDVKVTIAYFGALLCMGGLFALGLVALQYLKLGSHRDRLYWPRYTLLEGEVRHPFVARVALAAMLVIPIVTVYASLYRYHRDSKIACWNAEQPLDPGFFASRFTALSVGCPGSEMLRMVNRDGEAPDAVQWFFWTDLLLVLVFVAAVTAWFLYLRRLLRRSPSVDSGSAPTGQA